MEDRMQPVDDSAVEAGSRNILAILRRRLWIFIAVALVVMGAVAFYASVQPRIYEASTWMILSGLGDSGGAGDAAMFLTEADVWRSLQGDISMHVSLIRRVEMAERVREALNLDVPASALLGGVDVGRVPGASANLLNVSYRSEDPEQARIISDGWAREYERDSRDRSVLSTVSALEYVQDQIGSVEHDLRDMEEQIAHLEQRYLDSGISIASGAGGTRQSTLMQQVASNRIEMEAISAQIDRTLSRMEGEAREIEAVEEHPSHRAVAIEQQLSSHHVELQNLLQNYYEDSPEVLALQEQIERLEEQLEERSELTRTAVTTQPNPVYLNAQDALIGLYGQLDSYRARQSGLLAQLSEERARAETIPAGSITYNELMRKIQGLQAVHSSLLAQFYELQLKRATAVSPVQVVRAADTPQAPVSPQYQSILGAGVIAALLLGALAAVVLDQVDDTFAGPDEIREALQARLVGSLPDIQNGKADQIQVGGSTDERRNAFVNAARMLASTLRIEMLRDDLRSIVVTAAGRSEGKTMVATNLAAALASAGEDVLLIDADLHRPRVHEMVNTDKEIGLSNVLVGEITPEEAMQETEISNLHVIAAGPLPPSPVDLLASSRGREVISQLNKLADYVIWDTPPAGFLADATVIGHDTDRTLFVVGKRARRTATRQTVMHLREAGAEIIGVCANQVRRSGQSYYYYYDKDE